MSKSKPKFQIRRPRGPWPKKGLPAFVLEQDNWNDYGFRTLYRLSYVSLDSKGKIIEDLIGPLKILRAGQGPSDGLLVNESFDTLSPKFCSVGSSLDYYERLKKLPKKLRTLVLSGLNDVVASPLIERRFRPEPGWSHSLFRDDKDESYILLARSLLTGDYSRLVDKDRALSFTIPGWFEPIRFDFNTKTKEKKNTAPSTRISVLPERIAVIVGKNGSGKSTVLSRLARVALGTVKERDESPLKDLGLLEPAGVGFSRIISVAFSALDSFRLPGVDRRDRQKIVEELGMSDGRFAFIGLRDMTAEVNRQNPTKKPPGLASDPDRIAVTRLKSIDYLADEFTNFVKTCRETKRGAQLDKHFDSLLADSALASLLDAGISVSKVDEVLDGFFKCSTGHKIVALVVSGLIATLQPLSLVLFDEPESHLHPPLLAAMMHALRDILKRYNAYCVIATHSPIVVQESLAQNVKIVRRSGELASTSTPESETFGESIGLITAEVFGLNAEATDFHGVLDRLVARSNGQKEIEQLFLRGKMSHQARAYTMSRRLQNTLEEE